MSAFDFIGYFKNVAEKLKEILHTEDEKHFARVSGIAGLEEFLANMRFAKGYQLIVIANESGRFIDKSSDNLLVQPYFSFYVMKKVEHGNFDEKDQVISDCKAVCKKILSKMFNDKRNNLNGLYNLDRDTITYSQAGPFGHGFHGMNYNFTLLDLPGITYNPDDWNE
jgi:hypothetical protein